MLNRWDPFREMNSLLNTFDRVFEYPWNRQQWVDAQVPMDILETEEGYQVRASIPGLDPDDLDVTFSNNVLTIKGEIKPDEDVEHTRYYLRERWSGKFQRSLTLPVKIDAEDIQANYQAGVLTLFLPKSEEVRPKRIQIQSGARPKMIEERVTQTA